MDLETFTETRFDGDAWPLAVGDVLALVALITVGTMSHTTGEFLLENPLYLAGVVAPFLIGWVVIAPLVGAYSPGAVESAKSSVPLVVRSWIPAVAIGFLLRVTVFGDTAALPFVIVLVVLGTVVLAGWRFLYFKTLG